MDVSSEGTSIQTAEVESESSILREGSSCYEAPGIWIRNE